MSAYGRTTVVAALLAVVAAPGCSKDEAKGDHQIWFMGAVFDGATGQHVTGYTITLVYGSHMVNGTVDANTGRYTLGPLPAWNDYGVLISASSYRSFSSYNAGIAPPAPSTSSINSDVYTANTTQTKDFDAYLFPAALTVPATTVTIVETGANAGSPSGSIRLQPTSSSVIQGAASEVPMQVWGNDDDILASVISDSFASGSYAVPAGMLVYGVSYQVIVYDVTGYQPGMGTLQAGIQSGITVTVPPAAVTPLSMVSNTVSMCAVYNTSTSATTAAQVVLTFNQPIEDGTTTAGKGPEALDAGITAYTLDSYPLKTNASSAVQERGTSFVISGNTLTISWNPSVGLTSVVSGDIVEEVIYNNLSTIYLEPIGHPESRATLSTLLAATQITCYM
jgi:hypothetical protein